MRVINYVFHLLRASVQSLTSACEISDALNLELGLIMIRFASLMVLSRSEAAPPVSVPRTTKLLNNLRSVSRSGKAVTFHIHHARFIELMVRLQDVEEASIPWHLRPSTKSHSPPGLVKRVLSKRAVHYCRLA